MRDARTDRELREQAEFEKAARRCREECNERAVLRAIAANWMSDREIAEDLGCPLGFVNLVRTRHGLNKFRRSA